MRIQHPFTAFAEMRRRNPKNAWRSFTHGAILYDYINNSGTFAELGYWIEQNALELVQIKLEAKRDAVYNLSDKALAEILDISELDEIASPLFE